MKQASAIGVDIGGTKLAFALVDNQGNVLDSCQMPTLAGRDSMLIIKDIADGINRMKASASVMPIGIGLGIPGQIINESIIKNAVNLGWQEIHLVDQLKSLLNWDIPMRVMKDADASLWGEFHFGAAQNSTNCLYLCIGSGLGGSIIANRHLLSGANGTAAGIGHILLEPDGFVCNCGLKGCAETIISGPGLVRVYQDLIKTSPGLINQPSQEITTHTILQAALAGQTTARQALSQLSRGLGKIISICISLLNPDTIVLGGGLALASFNMIVPDALEEVKKHALKHTYDELRIFPSRLSSSAVGPASLVWFPDA